ncbi:hypothetical protein MGAD_40120 [Mycolicibacterium gadium]|uniref:Cas12f1-like TNB domain-containing protein n=1 Tax=Mycolicibacterium gadium TaxID=1794 RepID=A0A7I7WSI8_MYCGU|nr:hypothetical protein MGAD_40120 [Mycolicibacterium gadium]
MDQVLTIPRVAGGSSRPDPTPAAANSPLVNSPYNKPRPTNPKPHSDWTTKRVPLTGMLHNRRLARRIAGAGWGELRRQLSYKSQWRGGELIVADRFYASSKLCSGCGATKAKLRLSERVYHCETCGVTLDRDLNAARNLAALASQAAGGTSSPSCGATLNEPAGNPQKAGQVGSGYRHGKPRVGNAA